MAGPVIEIIDHDDTASSIDGNNDNQKTTTKGLGKRKLSFVDGDKVEWTDDSDDGEKLRERAAKRRTTAKGKKAAGKAKSTAKNSAKIKPDPDAQDDDDAAAYIPDYLQERRKQFDKNRDRLKEAGLKLPPDYGDIYFSDDEILSKFEERPKFDDASGIKPSRPYKDVELEYSAGVIPASIAQYLRDYQIEGVKFLHQRFVYQKGAILGDDMGLGKTVQVAAFLTAAFGKTGDERDAKRMRKMRRAGNQWYPIVLIICPGSVIQNWKNELNRWGWWHVDVFHGPGREDVLQAAKAGRLEIMITTYVTYKKSVDAVNTVDWDCVVADECHVLKDRRSETTKAMDKINAMCRIGLTGTAIQNKYEELWTLLNWTNPGQFGTRAEWHAAITTPLTLGQSHDATMKQLSVARVTAKKLVKNLLPEFFLRRMKTLIAHQLPKKSDKVVFCPLTDIQREAYENFIEGDAVQFIMTASDPCTCGSKRKRGWCCFQKLPNTDKTWVSAVFPSMITLQKIANHLTLLIPSASDPNDKQKSELKTLKTCIPHEWEEIYRNRDSMLNLANPEFCGKWKVLRKLLSFWHSSGDKVLVFSHSVRLLKILQHLFHNTSYNVSFLDGSLGYEERQRVVDEFNADPAQFVFLISTKAGGVGLNITSANKVVIFDPHWNPSYDLQAQDRAYRIGQVRDVDVFRLVSAGTIEEIVYARQIYKQQQANIGYNASSERRYFKGVQQDSNRKGEIFGLANLFSYHADQVVLREIVNKTNIAEAKAGVNLTELNLDKVVKDEAEDDELNFVKQEEGAEDEDTGGMSQLAKLLTAEDQEELLKKRSKKPKSDAVAAILASAGVEYTHENSEVIGTSKVEAQLSRRAELAGTTGGESQDFTLFADTDLDYSSDEIEEFDTDEALAEVYPVKKDPAKTGGTKGLRMHYRFNPPEAVRRRQFCSMAKEFGFSNATDFALVVESWTQEQRRNCLDTFYKAREMRLLEKELAELDGKTAVKAELKAGVEAGVAIVTVSPQPEGPNKIVKKNDKAVADGDAEELGKKVESGEKGGGRVEEPRVSPPVESGQQRQRERSNNSDGDGPDLGPVVQDAKSGGSSCSPSAVEKAGNENKRVSAIFLYDDEDDEDDEL